jgi:hypothetical protein
VTSLLPYAAVRHWNLQDLVIPTLTFALSVFKFIDFDFDSNDIQLGVVALNARQAVYSY